MIVLVGGALGAGIVKLPGTASTTSPGTTAGQFGDPAGSSGPVQSPPPIDNQATPVKGQLTLGDVTPVQAITLDSNGASPTVSAPGQPWDGLTIDIPAGTWSGATLQVTAQPISGSSFGNLVTPISPFYTVSGAEGMAPTPVTLKIPATIPSDSFAMGFFYDASSGQLEGMPLLAEGGTSVTVATEHFSSFFLSLVRRDLLPTTIDSGFRPGKDDWQFTNLGSYITPNGECAGQVLTEAWYYIERHLKAGASRLYGLYDNNGAEKTPDLWQDDSNGYRLASVAQSQYQANNQTAFTFFSNWTDADFAGLEYDSFRYAIAVTGEPQLVAIWDAQAASGHAILAYRVAPSGIFVADPNYPASWRLIPFDPATGKFGTYFSGANASAIADGKGTSYTEFVYEAKTALVDWSDLAADWSAFDAGAIGNGQFPGFALVALAGKDGQGNDIWSPLVDGYQTPDSKLTLRLRDPQNAGQVQMGVLRGTSSTYVAPRAQQVTFDLAEGANPLGILEQGHMNGWQYWEYVNFVRLTVTRGAAQTSGWVLTKSEGKTDYPNDAADATIGNSFALADGSITLTSWGPQASGGNIIPGTKETMSGATTWKSPPSHAVPGDKWDTTLSVTPPCPLAMPLLLHIVTYDQSTAKSSDILRTTADPCKPAVSASGSFVYPSGSSGDTFQIEVYEELQGINGGYWTYTYEWRP